ncbi:hypothetical protein OUZ56_033216 [Daphnia magna]|uniref:Uncharacterized protein n=1 Tax=Daphnia magna TaxID=35525 RepID=A0ABR0BAT1_9CRUS|nr:hypothetical protein OUZ56_007364 [Daphnia magna]KAK4045570.1 hypothetical protein OUZ56_033216 [Daphnia magna]
MSCLCCCLILFVEHLHHHHSDKVAEVVMILPGDNDGLSLTNDWPGTAIFKINGPSPSTADPHVIAGLRSCLPGISFHQICWCSSGDGLFGIFLRFGSHSGEYLLAGFLLRFSTWFPLGMLEVLIYGTKNQLKSEEHMMETKGV